MPTDGGRGDDTDDRTGDDPWGRDESDGGWDLDDDTETGGDEWSADGTEWNDPAGIRDEPSATETPSDGKPPREGPLWAVGAAVGLTVAAFLLGVVVTVPFVIAMGQVGMEIGMLASLVLSFVLLQYVGFGTVSLGYLRWRRIDFRDYVGIEVPSLRELGVIVGGWLLMLLLVLLASIVISQLGLQPAENQTTQQASGNPVLLLYLIPVMFLIVGPMEELLFRGIIQGRLREAIPPAPAIVLTAAIFALVHVVALTGGLSNRLTTISILFIPSLVFGVQYEYTDNLVVNVLTHAIYNSTLLLLAYWISGLDEETLNEGANAVLAML